MSAEQSEPMILVIGIHDDFSHVYDNEKDLLADGEFCAEAGGRFGALEFFDSEGYRLAGTYDGQWHLLGMTRTAECDDKMVLQRIQDSLKQLRRYIESHSEEFDTNVDEALGRVPDLNGSSDLAMSMRTLTEYFGQSDPGIDDDAGMMVPRGFVRSWCQVTGWCRR